jgi:hypothetical protein
VLRGESLRSIAMDWNDRGIKPTGGNSTRAEDKRADQRDGAAPWHRSMIRRVLMSPRITGLKEHRGEIVGEAT